MTELERLDRAIAAGADIAIGSRALTADGVRLDVRWYRRAIGWVFRAFVGLLGTRGIGDTQCGFKLFKGSVARDLFSRSRVDGFAFDVEILMLAQRQGLSIAEVPVNWAHQDGSRINLATDSLRMLRDLVKIRVGVILDRNPRVRSEG
jgi:dolichyl-phosphate beta-glucosyltransferase